MQLNIQNVSEYLKAHGIKPSFQRLQVFEYLIEYRNHPTVEMIFQELVKKIPTLSKTTVYNTLNLFIQKKIAMVIIIEENETRYDADTSLHGHFKCQDCGDIIDLDMDLVKIDIPSLKMHQVNEHHIYFKGVCADCLKIA